MIRSFVTVMAGAVLLCSCGNKESTPSQTTSTQAPAASQGGSPHAVVLLKDGSSVPGEIAASTATNVVVNGDDGIERTIPLDKVQSIQYGGSAPAAASQQAAAPAPGSGSAAPAASSASAPPPPPPQTFELPAGAEVSVRTNELIDSGAASEGQTFGAQVTRNVKDASGNVVLPHGSAAQLVIKSASKGGHFRGASDLVLDLQSVVVGGNSYTVHAGDIQEQGKQGVGANKRTGEFAGGGAALGAIIGAIAGGGKGAAIGAASGGGGGVAAELLTKGGSIKIPAETVLTFKLARPLDVTAGQ
ncbi:MAG TPA: hypothetical protein VMU19_01680 [Bryobacteraceae bacterium]|nr:hypothetical protein [Bryobacteraceae bacterium]